MDIEVKIMTIQGLKIFNSFAGLASKSLTFYARKDFTFQKLNGLFWGNLKDNNRETHNANLTYNVIEDNKGYIKNWLESTPASFWQIIVQYYTPVLRIVMRMNVVIMD